MSATYEPGDARARHARLTELVEQARLLQSNERERLLAGA